MQVTYPLNRKAKKKKGETVLQNIDYFNSFSSACIFELPEEL